MVNTFKYVLLSLLRERAILIWALAFPIVLSCCFIMMFQGLDEVADNTDIRVAVVKDEAYQDDANFSSFIDTVNSDGVLSISYVDTADQAQSLVLDSQDNDDALAGYVQVDDAGYPQVELAPTARSNQASMIRTSQAVLVTLMDEYTSKVHLVKDMMADNPMTLMNPAVTESIFETKDVTQKVELTQSAPRESARFYFALLGMAAMFGAQAALIAVGALLPNTSALGARRALGATSRTTSLFACILASWTASFACLLIAFVFVRVAAGVDLAGRDLPCIGVLAAASLMATALGALVGSLPKISTSAKAGLLTGLTCFAALFAGLYGEPTMALADMVEAAIPASTFINPAVQVSQALYSLMYFDSLTPMLQHVRILLAMAVVFFVVASRFLRRQRYASL